MDESEILAEDAAIRFLDRGGKWQWIQLVLVLFTYVSSGHTTFIIVFTGFQPNFACNNEEISSIQNGSFEHENVTDAFDNLCMVFNSTSNTSLTCKSGFRYEVAKEESIVSEWNLVCDKAYLSEVSQLLFVVGSAVGAISVAAISDRVGRRWTFLVTRALCLLTTNAIIFLPGIAGFMVLRFFIGIFLTGTAVVRAVYLTELSPIKIRSLMTMVAGVTWGVSLCTIALIGHLMRGMNWRYIQAAVSTSFVTVILEIIFVKESLLWLYANGKDKEASALLRRAMKTNGIREESLLDNTGVFKPLKDKDPLPCLEDVNKSTKNLDSVENTSDAQVVSNPRTMTLIDMMKNKTTRNLIFIIAVVWFVTSLVYYGLSLMSSAMSGDRILNFFFIGVVEIPACIGLYIGVQHWGRRNTMIVSFVVCGLSLLLAGILRATLDGTSKIILMQVVTFIGKFAISATFILLYFYTTELLPTNFRTTGLGIGSFSSKVGSCLSPFSSVLLRLLPWGPGVIFGSFCLLATLLFLLVPETHRRQLPQTVIEIENWQKEEKECNEAKKESRPIGTV